MRILMVGGTRFIGRHVVDRALSRGHDVTVFHRGRTNPGLFPGVDVRTGDRDSDLSALSDGEWDATVDTCAYLPSQVHALADVLGERGGHYLVVSSVSAYAPPSAAGFTEDSPLAELADPTVDVVTNETYGGLKVLVERAAVDRFGSSSTIVRPTYVVGPDDYTWRFPYWVDRIARGGEVLAPGPAEAPAQVIDVRDLADWMVDLLEAQQAGPFHAVSPHPPFSFGDQLEAIRAAVAPDGTSLTWIDAEWVKEQGLDGGVLPLWSGDDPEEDRLMMTADPSAAEKTGLTPRPLADTVRDTLAWIRSTAVPRPDGVGVDADREADLLATWRALRGG